jgi:hypothetical protein
LLIKNALKIHVNDFIFLIGTPIYLWGSYQILESNLWGSYQIESKECDDEKGENDSILVSSARQDIYIENKNILLYYKKKLFSKFNILSIL